MIKISNDEDSNIISTTVTQDFSPRDWERLIPALVRKKLHHERVGWCLELKDFNEEARETGLEENALEQFDSQSISRIAIIADNDLKTWAEDLVAPFSSAEVRYYDSFDQAEAQEWLKAVE